MKKLLLVLLASLFSFTVYAADVETGTVAELYEKPYGRSVVYDSSELITIWYTGSSNGAFGVSGTTAGVDLELTFYEDAQEITDTRFGGYAQISLYDPATVTENTVEQIVSIINSDTSKVFKAALGRDATPGTAILHALTADYNLLSTNEDDSIANGDVVKDDTSSSDQFLAGVRANGRRTYRLKSIRSNVKGASQGDTVNLKVWDGEETVWRAVYIGSDYESATATTVSFTDYGAKGLSSHKGENLTVVIDRSSGITGTSEEICNMSVVIGEWTE